MKRRFFLHVIICVMVSGLLIGCQQNVPAPSASPNVQGSIDLARKTTSSIERDSILLGAVGQAQSVTDILALARTCYSSTNRDNILLQGVNFATDTEKSLSLAFACASSIHRDQILRQGCVNARNVDDVLTLARACTSSTNRDQLLLQGVKLANTNEDYTKLAQACYSSSNRDRILTRASEGSTTVSQPPSDELSKAYDEMQAAYLAYQKGVNDGVANSQLKALANDYKAKKENYDRLVRK